MAKEKRHTRREDKMMEAKRREEDRNEAKRRTCILNEGTSIMSCSSLPPGGHTLVNFDPAYCGKASMKIRLTFDGKF
jgi:hypothetical protein